MKTVTHYRGQEVPTELLCRTGEHEVEVGGKAVPAVRSMQFDSGAKLGVSLCYQRGEGEERPESEREENRRNLSALCRSVAGRSGAEREK